MLRIKKMTVALMLLIITVSISGCVLVDFFSELFHPNLIIIRGQKVISGEGEIYIIPKGSTVQFKMTWLGEEEGELVIKDGAKLIAQGTADEPIIFQEGSDENGGIIELQATASNDSVVEYCYFKEFIAIKISNLFTVRLNKFFNASIEFYSSAAPTIEYNTFDGDNYRSLICSQSGTSVSPTIKNNIIMNGDLNGLIFFIEDNPTIESNNITNCSYKAIQFWNLEDENVKLIVTDNYIANCDGKSGVDITGAQCSSGVVYGSYLTTPVADAGCGW